MSPRRASTPVQLLGCLGLLLAVGWALGRLAVAVTNGVDLSVVRDVARDRTAALTAVAHALSFLGSGWLIVPLAVLLVAALVLGRRYAAAWLVALGTLGGEIISNLDKALVGRPRPPVHHLEHVVTPSFPSGHATESSAFYVAVLLVVLAVAPRHRRPAAVATAVLVVGVALSRVYLGVHYPSDVVAGMALGATWSLAAARVLGVRGVARGQRPPPAG